jgi:hypothetical protein
MPRKLPTQRQKRQRQRQRQRQRKFDQKLLLIQSLVKFQNLIPTIWAIVSDFVTPLYMIFSGKSLRTQVELCDGYGSKLLPAQHELDAAEWSKSLLSPDKSTLYVFGERNVGDVGDVREDDLRGPFAGIGRKFMCFSFKTLTWSSFENEHPLFVEWNRSHRVTDFVPIPDHFACFVVYNIGPIPKILLCMIYFFQSHVLQEFVVDVRNSFPISDATHFYDSTTQNIFLQCEDAIVCLGLDQVFLHQYKKKDETETTLNLIYESHYDSFPNCDEIPSHLVSYDNDRIMLHVSSTGIRIFQFQTDWRYDEYRTIDIKECYIASAPFQFENNWIVSLGDNCNFNNYYVCIPIMDSQQLGKWQPELKQVPEGEQEKTPLERLLCVMFQRTRYWSAVPISLELCNLTRILLCSVD